MINQMKTFLWTFLGLLFSFSVQGQTESDYLKKWARYIQEDVDSCLILSDEISKNSNVKLFLVDKFFIIKEPIKPVAPVKSILYTIFI